MKYNDNDVCGHFLVANRGMFLSLDSGICTLNPNTLHYLYPHTSITDTPQLLEFLLGTLYKEFLSIGSRFYYVESSLQIQQIKDPVIRGIQSESSTRSWNPIRTGLSTIDFQNNSYNMTILKELTNVRNNAVASIGSHIRQSILKDHKSCIRRYVTLSKIPDGPEPPVCPFAYAYVKWKQSLMKMDYYYDVDNKIYQEPRPSVQNIMFTTYADRDPLLDVIDACIQAYPIHFPE